MAVGAASSFVAQHASRSSFASSLPKKSASFPVGGAVQGSHLATAVSDCMGQTVEAFEARRDSVVGYCATKECRGQGQLQVRLAASR